MDTTTQGGGLQFFGQNLAEVLNAASLDLEGNAVLRALEEVGRSPTNFEVPSAMYPNPGMSLVRANSGCRMINNRKTKPIPTTAASEFDLVFAKKFKRF